MKRDQEHGRERTEDTQPAVVVSDLSIGYGAHSGGNEFAAVREAYFEVGNGAVAALLGESGSGKSTLASYLAARALAPADKTERLKTFGGEARVLGRPIARAKRKDLAELALDVGYLEQNGGANLNPDFTISDILLEPVSRKHKKYDQELFSRRIVALLERVGLPLDMLNSYPFQLSKGQRQRIAVIKTLVLHPKLIVLDEPTMGIDPNSRPLVIDLIAEHIEQTKASAIVISHDITLLERLVDEAIIMQDGRIVGTGQLNDVFADASHTYVQRLASALRSRAYDEAFDA